VSTRNDGAEGAQPHVSIGRSNGPGIHGRLSRLKAKKMGCDIENIGLCRFIVPSKGNGHPQCQPRMNVDHLAFDHGGGGTILRF